MTFENLRYWPLIVGGCSIAALLMVLAYLRSSRPINSPTRFLLAALRVLMVGVILFCLLQPVVTETVTFTERSPFFVLVDLSTSMEIKDCGSGRSRGDVTVSVLDSVAGQLADMRTQHDLHVVGFGKEQVSIADPGDLPPADMTATAIGDALESLLRRAKGRAHGGVLVLSDGTNNHGRTPTPYGQYFKEAGLPIFPVLLGDSTPTGRVRDIKVFSLNCPNSALVGTSVSVLAEVSFLGFKGKSFPVRLKLGEETAQVRTVDVTHDQQAVKLAFLLPVEKEGQHQVSVEIERQEDELDSKNNRLTTILNVGKETINVCYLEGRLRWERKFLLRILSEMEGLNVDARMLPAEPLERERFLAGLDFSGYKAIILGDISAGTLGVPACQRIYDAVAQSGCGIAILGGPNSFGPGGYPDSPLYALCPVRMATSDAYERRSVRVGLTRVGQTHFVTALKEDSSDRRGRRLRRAEVCGLRPCPGGRPIAPDRGARDREGSGRRGPLGRILEMVPGGGREFAFRHRQDVEAIAPLACAPGLEGRAAFLVDARQVPVLPRRARRRACAGRERGRHAGHRRERRVRLEIARRRGGKDEGEFFQRVLPGELFSDRGRRVRARGFGRPGRNARRQRCGQNLREHARPGEGFADG
ncbi:MAG: vWA domain-containing protein [Planctomycetota bacterium]|nr:vWA domain-containing protein [Planctomycetota bacterium]